MENQSYEDHPAYMSTSTVQQVAQFLADAINTHALQSITIDLHGGEPLMIGKARFKKVCQILRNTITGCKLNFSVQTNATLIDREWIAIFAQYNVGVGISLDGPPAYNDLNRIDKKKRGTHAKVAHAITLLHEAVAQGQIAPIEAICVINPFSPAAEIYRHFVDVLAVKKLHFVLPDKHHGNYDRGTEKFITAYLTELFHEWIRDDNPEVDIRVFQQMAYAMAAGAQDEAQIQAISQQQIALTIASNGDVCPDDTLRNVLVEEFNQAPNVWNIDLQQFIKWQAQVIPPHYKIPSDCQPCRWRSTCHMYYQSETKLHQYHPKKGFHNPSVYCPSLQSTYHLLFDYLFQHSTPEQCKVFVA
jgi:uncharacterized protein